MISPYSFLKSKIRSLEISAGDLGLTPCSCAVIVTDVKTGKVKALTSYPSYDNNKFANSVDADSYAKQYKQCVATFEPCDPAKGSSRFDI